MERITGLGFMILSLLFEGAMHPYGMVQLMLRRHDDRIVSLATGTVYRTVTRLQNLGLLTPVGVDRSGNRTARTTYAITETGRAIVGDWVRQELPRIDRPAEFRVALAQAHHLDRLEVVDLLRSRRDQLHAALRQQRDTLREASEEDVPE
ncbi:PadR family transcriptional regulator [Agromyces sp. Soil535]|uniref:PadR family transcriptional regulator n=1 Tax=Agromyces sp. Soil535 TaxID=1736390 RepID=UPI000A493AD8|nr:PadR family transcriptional regulator [Agromyces sp. Soil535]